MTLINILIAVGVFFLMEFVAWFTHKYIMHGFLWSLHKDHHVKTKSRFELNDFFGIFFAAIAIMLITLGVKELNYLFWIGIGMTAYGLAYFIFHDVIVHKRIKIGLITRSRYLQGIIKAHKIHHSNSKKEECRSFGFLYTKKEYRT